MIFLKKKKRKVRIWSISAVLPYPLNIIARWGLSTTVFLVSFLFSHLSYAPKPSFQLLLQDVLVTVLNN